MNKSVKIIIATALILNLGSQSAYPMTTVNDWIGKVKDMVGLGDATGDASTDVVGDMGAISKDKVFSPAEARILINLKKREAELRRKEDEQKKTAKELKILSQEIEQKLDKMRTLAGEIEAKREARKETDEKDISRMVKYYETMQPENTAVFFNTMDLQTAMQILMKMNPRKASAVMQLLEPKVAIQITEEVTRFKTNREERRQK